MHWDSRAVYESLMFPKVSPFVRGGEFRAMLEGGASS